MCSRGLTARLVASGGQVLCALALLAAPAGCSVLASRTQDLEVSSVPVGAEVWVNEQFAGTTPVTRRIRRWDPATVTIKKEGYRTISRTTTRSLSGVGVADVILGSFVLVPCLGLLSGGAWEQSPSDIQVNLSRE